MNKFKVLYKENKNQVDYILKLFLCFIVIRSFFNLIGQQDVPIEKRIIPTLSFYFESFNNALRDFYFQSTYAFIAAIRGHFAQKFIIGHYCLGVQLWLYFACVIICYKDESPWYRKLIFILVGVLLINVVNILRFVGILYVASINPAWLEFSHDVVFNGSIYAFSIFMLIQWINRYSKA